MKKYRKKPLVIEAIKWDGNDRGQTMAMLKEYNMHFNVGHYPGDGMLCELEIHTPEGTMTAEIGDYIIKGIKGEFYPVKNDVFHKLYDEFIDEMQS